MSLGDASASDCAIGAIYDPIRFKSSRFDAFTFAGFIAKLTHRPPCCPASRTKYSSVLSLSPFMLALLVKPPKTLSCHLAANQGLAEASANFLNCQLGPPM